MSVVSLLNSCSYLSTTQYWWSCWFLLKHLYPRGRVCITKQSKTIATLLACSFFFVSFFSPWVWNGWIFRWFWFQWRSTHKINNNNLLIFTPEKEETSHRNVFYFFTENVSQQCKTSRMLLFFINLC